MVGGLLWLFIWAVYLGLHGTSEDDVQGLLLGLTHNDFSKFLVIALLLTSLGLFALWEGQRTHSGLAGRVGFTIGVFALIVTILAVAGLYWSLPWGSYAADFGQPILFYGGLTASLSTIFLAIGMVPFAFDVARRGIWPSWMGVLLVVGPLTIIPWLHGTLTGCGYGLAWLLLGYGIWRGRLRK